VKLVSGMAYGVVIAKFHYTDTDTDFFAAKRTRTDPTEFRRKKVRVRVVEFSYYCCVSDSAVSRCRMTDSEPTCRSHRRSVGHELLTMLCFAECLCGCCCVLFCSLIMIYVAVRVACLCTISMWLLSFVLTLRRCGEMLVIIAFKQSVAGFTW